MIPGSKTGQNAKRILQEPLNSHRLLVKVVKACAAERGIKCVSHSQDWILELSKDHQRRTIYGYDFGLNRSSTFQLMNDKAGFTDACLRQGIPAVAHQVFLHPRLQGYVPGDGNWPAIRAAFLDWGQDVVVKNNSGTGGKDVVRVTSMRGLEQTCFTLFQVARAICLSPFLPLKQEVRVITVDKQILLAYEKARTLVFGDGQAPLSVLIAQSGIDIEHAANQPVDAESGEALNLFDVPGAGRGFCLIGGTIWGRERFPFSLMSISIIQR